MPDSITHTALMSAYTKGEQPEQAPEVFLNMLQLFLPPNVVTCNALLGACQKGEEPERAHSHCDR